MRMYHCHKYTARLVEHDHSQPTTDSAWNTFLAALDHAIEQLDLPSHIFASLHGCHALGEEGNNTTLYVEGIQYTAVAGAFLPELSEERNLFRIRASVFFAMYRLHQDLAGTIDHENSDEEAEKQAKVLNDSFVPRLVQITPVAPERSILQFFWMNLADTTQKEFVAQCDIGSTEEYNTWVEGVRERHPQPEGWTSLICNEKSENFLWAAKQA